MQEPRQDLRAHPLATALALALWGAITWLVGAVGASYLFPFALLLLLPAGVAAFLVGRRRRMRGARSSGLVAALVASLVVLDLSIAALLIDEHFRLGRSFWRDWGEFLAPLALFVHLAGLVVGYAGWLLGHEAVYPEEPGEPAG